MISTEPAIFLTLQNDLKSDLSKVSSSPIGSTVRINWGSTQSYARKVSSNSWVTDSGIKYDDHALASNADFWTKITINTMVR